MDKLLPLGLCTLFLLSTGCNVFGPRELKEELPPATIRIVDELPDLPTDALDVQAATVAGDVLVLRVQYSGGCAEHDIELYATGAFMESHPVQAALYLSHDDHDDPCDGLVVDTLAFGLRPLKAAYQQGYGASGTIILRLSVPGDPTPYEPGLRYSF